MKTCTSQSEDADARSDFRLHCTELHFHTLLIAFPSLELHMTLLQQNFRLTQMEISSALCLHNQSSISTLLKMICFLVAHRLVFLWALTVCIMLIIILG